MAIVGGHNHAALLIVYNVVYFVHLGGGWEWTKNGLEHCWTSLFKISGSSLVTISFSPWSLQLFINKGFSVLCDYWLYNDTRIQFVIVGSLLNDEVFNYAEESRNACRNGSLSDDVVQEINKLKRADLVIFQFPLYWSSVPAILKGWFDRVFCDSFACDFESQKILDQGFMKVSSLYMYM